MTTLIRKYCFAILLFPLCSVAQPKKDTLCIIQINDVYEISPLQNGKAGGMARVASIIKENKKHYQTFAVVAGDFLNPSVMGTASYENEKINGRQMVDLFNHIGINLVTFGNHEFDIPEKVLQQRINESNFEWISSNVFEKDSAGNESPFYKLSGNIKQPFNQTYTLSSKHKQFAVTFFALTLAANQQNFVSYHSYDSSLKPIISKQNNSKNILIGLTHLLYKEDSLLMTEYPAIKHIIGGHEHQNMKIKAGSGYVTKADANAKSIYRHLIYINKKGLPEISSQLINLDESISKDSSTNVLVDKWEQIAYQSFRNMGLEPTNSVCRLKDTLNGLESSIRYEQNNMGGLVTDAMIYNDSLVDAAIINSGSIRIDDKVAGDISELDIIRIMPFGGKLIDLSVKGNLLLQVLNTNDSRKGLGGYLQMSKGFEKINGIWYLKKAPVAEDKVYKIRTIEFLASGKETGLGYFKTGNVGITAVMPVINHIDNTAVDIRKQLIAYLKTNF
ncbi:MAG: bifunctional metallophosphatase/5'-nucleotidase [Bacteroidota bacterium]|nr:bifunctional metallophosphatase/5'-nucleotidase [Bacteroidota bacterium]